MNTLTRKDLDGLRLELSVKAKNGINFIVAATLVWILITLIWISPYNVQSKAILTFIVGALLLPLAWLFSKLLHTIWTVETNPLQPLGLWLNFAQLIYFPILIFVYIRHVEYFIFVYAVITGAHLFPYTWFYKTSSYAVMAVVSSIGSMLISLVISSNHLYFIPGFIACSLALLAIWVYADYRKNQHEYLAAFQSTVSRTVV